MFEIMRPDPAGRTARDIMSWMAAEPLFRSVPFAQEDGGLAVDVSENDGDVFVRASLPGFARENIDVQVHNGVLTIKAERADEKETKDEKFYVRERRSGSVSRRIALPGVLADGKAEATFQDGVLAVRIPQGDDAKPKRVAIR